MKLQEAIKTLTEYQKWRLGNDDIPSPIPKIITEALDVLLNYHIVDTNEMISFGDKIRYQKLETLAKLLAKSWFYGNWKWESPNERVQQMLMQELGYYPFKDEDEMIYHTKVDENLYKQAANEIKGWSELPKDISISSQTEISDEEIEKLANDFFVDYEKVGVTQWEVSAFIMGMKEYREQLKKKQ